MSADRYARCEVCAKAWKTENASTIEEIKAMKPGKAKDAAIKQIAQEQREAGAESLEIYTDCSVLEDGAKMLFTAGALCRVCGTNYEGRMEVDATKE